MAHGLILPPQYEAKEQEASGAIRCDGIAVAGSELDPDGIAVQMIEVQKGVVAWTRMDMNELLALIRGLIKVRKAKFARIRNIVKQ